MTIERLVPLTDELVKLLQSATHIIAITGAGISAESGIPTFRQSQTGLWAKYDPAELATPNAFLRNPQLVWDWYCWRRRLVLDAEPNAGHYALAEMAQLARRFTLITQNVDGLHQRAGSGGVVELHGSIRRAKCFDNHHVVDKWPDDSLGRPPLCGICQSLMRPDVVWFEECLPPSAIGSAIEAARRCDVLFSIGTSSLVYPASHVAQVALQNGAAIVEINPCETPLTRHAHFSFPTPAAQILPLIVGALRHR
jgi:NAD-dependent deacetylase